MSSFFIQDFFAGDHFINLSTFIQTAVFSTIAHIHSKSQARTSLNFFVSSLFINSECLSQIAFIIQDIAQFTKSDFFT
jgi:hypothetical protein